jgi:hypothetical protein
MTKTEALHEFQLDDAFYEDDLIDLYEEKIFEFKQYFLSKTPIFKLFESKLSKLEKIGNAYNLLTNINVEFTETKLEFNGSQAEILANYLHFQEEKNRMKTKISNSENAFELVSWVKNLLELEKMNAQHWFSEIEIDANILVSKEPNPMEILEGIKIYQQNSGFNFDQLKKLENNPPEILIQEMKRLSLLFKKY